MIAVSKNGGEWKKTAPHIIPVMYKSVPQHAEVIETRQI